MCFNLVFFLFVEACVAVNFINNFGSQFKLYSSLKHEGYLATGSGFKLKLMIDRPELHSHVVFSAEDPDGKRKILLNEEPSISAAVVAGCPEFLDVFVTAEQGIAYTRMNSSFYFTTGVLFLLSVIVMIE